MHYDFCGSVEIRILSIAMLKKQVFHCFSCADNCGSRTAVPTAVPSGNLTSITASHRVTPLSLALWSLAGII